MFCSKIFSYIALQDLRRSLTMQSTGGEPTKIKGLAVRGPDGKLQRVSWLNTNYANLLKTPNTWESRYVAGRSKNFPMIKYHKSSQCQALPKWTCRLGLLLNLFSCVFIHLSALNPR